MKLYIKKLNEHAVVPKRATKTSAGYDLSACLDSPVTIKAGQIVKIPTGISCAPDREDVVLLIYIRSSLATKFGLALANSVGVVDSDYRGEIMCSVINLGDKDYTIQNGDRFAQLVITPVIFADTEVTENLSETERGCGGFGSTGKN